MLPRTRSSKPELNQGLSKFSRRVGRTVEQKKVVAQKSPSTSESSEESIGGDIRRNLEETLEGIRSTLLPEEFEVLELDIEPVELETVELGLDQLKIGDGVFEDVNFQDREVQDRIQEPERATEEIVEMAAPQAPVLDPLVRPRGLPVAMPVGLLAATVPQNLPKFYGTRDEDPTLHMERYIEILTTSLISNEGYYLVWFPGTLHGEAYNWYRDHEEAHFTTWTQLQVAFLNHFRPEVGQSTALKALSAVRQQRDEEMANYIRRFELVCMRYVGGLLNEDTLKQFFIEGFADRSTIKGVLERNPITLEQAKAAARSVEVIERSYERLWRKEDESIPRFIPINPVGVTAGGGSSNPPPMVSDNGPQYHTVVPMATRAPIPLLALPSPDLQLKVEELEKRIKAGQDGFQDSVMRQMQALTEQMAYMVRNQSQPTPPPRIESGNHNSGVWCTNCGRNGHSAPQCRDRAQGGNTPQNHPNQGQGRPRGPPQRQGGFQGPNQGYQSGNPSYNQGYRPRKEFHELCRRWHEPGQCWDEGQSWPCGNCGGNHSTPDCRQPDKVIQMPPAVVNPYENARNNMVGQRQNQGAQQDLRPSNMYYNYEESRQNHQPPMGLQTQQGYVPVSQPSPGGNQNYVQARPLHAHQDVRVAGELLEDPRPIVSTVEIKEVGSTSHLVTHELRKEAGGGYENATLAVMTRGQARREPEVVEQDLESEGSEQSMDLVELDAVAREAARLAREANSLVSDEESMGEFGEEEDRAGWEGPGIPVEDMVSLERVNQMGEISYDLWKDLRRVKADITIAQLLEVSPSLRKNLKERLPGVRRRRKPQKRMVARVQSTARPVDVKAVEIEVTIVDKVVPHVLIDGGSGLNIMPLHTMEKLGLSLTGPSPFVLNMADQSPAKPLGQISNCKISTGGEDYLVTFHVIRMHTSKESFPLLLGRPWLRMANATIMWGGDKPSIVYGPCENPTKVRIKPLIGLEVNDTADAQEDKTLTKVDGMSFEAEHRPLQCLGPNLYNWSDNGEFTTWLQDNPDSCPELEMGLFFIGVEMDDGLTPLVEIDARRIEVCDEEEVATMEEDTTLGGLLKFKTGSSGITAGEDVVSYPQVPADWYRDNNEQSHVVEEDWKFVTIEFEGEEPRQMRMGSQLSTLEVQAYSELVREYRDVFAWSYKDLKGIPPEIVEHRIPLLPNTIPVRQKERRMNPQLQLIVKEELEKLLQAGFIKPVEITDWVSPMVLVKKKNGKLRVCVDYRKLNARTQKDHFPLPFITSILEEVAGHDLYTFMDGYSGYNQVSIAVEDRHKTAFTTPWGTFVWHVMPFGLCNAPSTFQRLVMSIFSDLLYKSMTAFIDDFSTQSECEPHLACVRESFERCRRSRMALNPDKTYMALLRGILLGYMVSKHGREPEPAKIKTIQELTPPTTVKEVQRVLGHTGWYRELIENYATIAAPITCLQRKNTRFIWTKECDEAFEALKTRLSTYPVLRPPKWNVPFHIYCDASAIAVGSILCQAVNGLTKSKDHPIAYASRQLNPAEKNYSTTERECLAMIFSAKKFRHYLLSNKVVFYVDHMAIKYLVNKPELSGRLARWVLLLQEFDYTVEYKPGSVHKQADHMSRLPGEVETHPIDDSLIDENLFLITARPTWYAGIIEFLTTQQLSPEMPKEERRKIRVNSRHFVVLGNRLYRKGLDGVLRRCVMEEEVPSILSACHDSACGGHFSGQLTGQKILRAGYYWPSLFKDAHSYVRKCDSCQRFARNDLHMQLPLHVSLPLVPFEKWGIDYVGEIHPHSSRGMAYIVVATEYLTKWVEAKAVRTNDAKNAASFLFENIIARFGVPKILVSDRGTHFLNSIIEELTDRFQIDHRKTTPYHPQTNGQTERVNQTLATILRKTVNESKRDWDVKLHAALWAYRTTFKVTTKATPFSLVYGVEAVLPIEFEVPSLRIAVEARLTDKESLRHRLIELEAMDESRRRAAQHTEAIQRRRKVLFDNRNKTRFLQPGMLVLIQDARKIDFPSKFDAVWLGPYLVVEAFLNNSVQLETLNGQRFPTRTSGSRCKEYRV